MADDIRIGIAVVSDSVGSAKARKELQEVRKSITGLKSEFDAGDKSAAEFTKELAKLEKQEKDLKKAIDGTTGEFTAQAKAEKIAAAETKKLAAEQERLAKAEAKKAGQTGADKLQQIGRDIRGLPSVNVPGVGIGTDTFGRAAEVAGRLGVSVGQLGAAGLIAAPFVIALGVAINKLTKDIEKNIEATNSAIDVVGRTNEFLTEATTEEAEKRIAALERQKGAQEKTNTEIEAAQDAFLATGTVFTRLRGDYKNFTEQLEDGKDKVNEIDLEIRRLNEGIEEGATTAADAAAAEKQLATERSQGILTEAAQAGDLASLKERVNGLTREQIDSELEALDRRRTGTEAELAALTASGDTSEAVAKKIEELRNQLGFLGQQSDILKTARKSAKSAEAEKAAEKARKDAEREQEQAAKAAQKRAEDIGKAQQAYSDKLADIGQSFKDALRDIGQGLQDNLFDNNQELLDDLADSQLEFNQDQLKEERDFQRDIAQIKRDAARAEKDASRSRDFAALRDAREQRTNALQDRKRTEAESNQDELLDYQQHRAELMRERQQADRDDRLEANRAIRDAAVDRDRANRDAATQRQRALRDINTMEANHYQSRLNNLESFLSRVTDMESKAFGGSSSRRTSRSSRSSNIDQLASVLG
jgi:chromosome segregation ATPase